AGLNRTGAGSFGAADGLFGSIRFVAPAAAGASAGDPAPAVDRGVGVTLSGPSGPAVFGETVAFTATVTAAHPHAGPPRGTVVFRDGDTVLGSAELTASGQAVFQTSALAPGQPSIPASFTGGDAFDPALSVALAQAVSKAATATTLTSSAVQAVVG